MKWYIRRKIKKMIYEHVQNAQCTMYHIDHYHLAGEMNQPLWDKVEWEMRYVTRLTTVLNRYT